MSATRHATRYEREAAQVEAALRPYPVEPSEPPTNALHADMVFVAKVDGIWAVCCAACPEPHWVKPREDYPQIRYTSKRAADKAALQHRVAIGAVA